MFKLRDLPAIVCLSMCVLFGLIMLLAVVANRPSGEFVCYLGGFLSFRFWLFRADAWALKRESEQWRSEGSN